MSTKNEKSRSSSLYLIAGIYLVCILLFFNSYEHILYNEYFSYIGALGALQALSITVYLYVKKNLPNTLTELQKTLVQYFKEKRDELERITGEKVIFPYEEEPTIAETIEYMSRRLSGILKSDSLFFSPIIIFLAFILFRWYFLSVDPRIFYVLFSLYVTLVTYSLLVAIMILFAYHIISEWMNPMVQSRAFLNGVIWPSTVATVQEALEE